MNCCITNCEFNENKECLYCGDYFNLNSKNCIAFVSKYDDIEEAMTQAELNKLRGSILYEDEELYVVYTGNAKNFHKNKPIRVNYRLVKKTGLPFPQPKWVVSDFYIIDLDGHVFNIGDEIYGELKKNFKWKVINIKDFKNNNKDSEDIKTLLEDLADHCTKGIIEIDELIKMGEF